MFGLAAAHNTDNDGGRGSAPHYDTCDVLCCVLCAVTRWYRSYLMSLAEGVTNTCYNVRTAHAHDVTM
jgi:hypothetical protein